MTLAGETRPRKRAPQGTPAADLVTRLTGTHPMIYTYPNFASSYLTSTVTSHPLWIASYDHTDPATDSSVTGPWNGAYAFWQYTGSPSRIALIAIGACM